MKRSLKKDQNVQSLAEILSEVTGHEFSYSPRGTRLDPLGAYQHYGFLLEGLDEVTRETEEVQDGPFDTKPDAETDTGGLANMGDSSYTGKVLSFRTHFPAVVEKGDSIPPDSSTASTILCLPGLAPYELKKEEPAVRKHVLEIRIPEIHAFKSVNNALQSYVGVKDLSADVERIHTTLTTQPDKYRTLYEAGFVASEKHIKGKLFVGVVSNFVFHFDSCKKDICFLVGSGQFPPDCRTLPHKAILRVALGDPETKTAYVENYEVFRQSAFGRALKIHGIEGYSGVRGIRLRQKFQPKEIYEDLCFAIADCGYKIISLQSFDDIIGSYGGIYFASAKNVA